MSIETLLEAALYVEQQELRKQHLQSLLSSPNILPPRSMPLPTGAVVGTAAVAVASPPTGAFKIVSPVPLSGQQPQLSQSPPAALVALPQVHHAGAQAVGGHSLVTATSGHTATLVVASRPSRAATNEQNCMGMMATAQQPVVELLAKSLPLINGFDKSSLLLETPTSHSTQSSLPNHQSHDIFPTVHPAPSSITNHSAGKLLPPPATSKRQNSHSNGPVITSTTLSNSSAGHANYAGGQGPSVIRSGTREVHNKLEKNRRAHLKECFELLKKQLPPQQDEKKSSNLSILHSALRHIQALKKRERENEHEMERLAREKIAAQQRLVSLKKELGSQWDNIDLNQLMPENGNGVAHQALAASLSPPTQLLIKEEPLIDGAIEGPRLLQPATGLTPATATSTQLSVLPLHAAPVTAAGYHPVGVGQGLAVVGLHKLALVGNVGKMVGASPVAHIIATPPQLNGKVVPLVNAQYLMKPVVVVTTPSAASTAISPRQS